MPTEAKRMRSDTFLFVLSRAFQMICTLNFNLCICFHKSYLGMRIGIGMANEVYIRDRIAGHQKRHLKKRICRLISIWANTMWARLTQAVQVIAVWFT